MESTLRIVLAALAGGIVALTTAFALSGCAISQPFRGPGFDPDTGVTLDGVGPTVVVALTKAVVHRDRRGPFDDATNRVYDELPGMPGYIAGSVRKVVFGDEAWTMTVWRDEAALEDFVFSDLHQDAMDAGRAALREARFRRVVWPTAELPMDWRRAMDLLDADDGAPGQSAAGGYR